ncbi:unnamed protein product [Cuscuta epithymum]|uniref:Uncharacterized protein n=1 Tax=Cuscuta epithymum TaxID=186058 RepID=A0AAV0DGQ0_9ASTE|nr:unnamed protein product [Cuscuta epithymum]
MEVLATKMSQGDGFQFFLLNLVLFKFPSSLENITKLPVHMKKQIRSGSTDLNSSEFKRCQRTREQVEAQSWKRRGEFCSSSKLRHHRQEHSCLPFRPTHPFNL